jgi:septal ring factor EnvC (AmiA/AmiB activator)
MDNNTPALYLLERSLRECRDAEESAAQTLQELQRQREQIVSTKSTIKDTNDQLHKSQTMMTRFFNRDNCCVS